MGNDYSELANEFYDIVEDYGICAPNDFFDRMEKLLRKKVKRRWLSKCMLACFNGNTLKNKS